MITVRRRQEKTDNEFKEPVTLTDKDKEIILFFIQKDNELVLSIDIAKDRQMNEGWTSKRCQELDKKGILYLETRQKFSGKGRGFKPAYNMRESIHVLKTILSNFPLKTVKELMETTYYQNMEQPVMEYFEDRLVKENPTCSLSTQDKKNLRLFLSHSPSCLKFALEEDYKRISELKQNDQVYTINEFTTIARNALNLAAHQLKGKTSSEEVEMIQNFVTDEKYIIAVTSNIAAMICINSLSHIFGQLEASDYYFGYVPKDTYFADLREIQNNLPKIRENLSIE